MRVDKEVKTNHFQYYTIKIVFTDRTMSVIYMDVAKN